VAPSRAAQEACPATADTPTALRYPQIALGTPEPFRSQPLPVSPTTFDFAA
jgi:hypothetical protein